MGPSRFDLTPLAYRLKRLRKERGLSQRQLAREIDVSKTHISRIERSGGFNTTLEILLRLRDYFELDSIEELLGDIEFPSARL